MARAEHATSIKIDAKVVRHSGYVVFQMAGMLRFALTYPKANQLWMCDEQSKDKHSLVSLCTFWLLLLRAFLTGQL